MPFTAPARVGVVAIGRNEGERLRRCFDSIRTQVAPVVYVDSGSTDGSVELALGRGHEVVELDMTRPFTAARARNAGFSRLCEHCPGIEYVQFVDGDCALADGWLSGAVAALDAEPSVAAVWGRRRELHPEQSIYNRVCDVEWAQEPPGDTQVFGGDVLVRVSAVRELGGYDPRIIAGEDPEFAYRLHRNGHRILRLDAEMTRHDAGITRFGQWWTRSKRSGYAYAQVSSLHGSQAERFWVKDTRRALFWGMVVPALVPTLALPTLGLSSLLLSIYPLRAVRIARHAHARGVSRTDARFWALHCVGASVPQALGILSYHIERWRGKDPTIIEYKASDAGRARDSAT
jgi:glycosyltransferase involved in cell wall biosynthesis